MEIGIYILLIYVLSILAARHMNYITYKKGYIDSIIYDIWYIPVVNILFILITFFVILKNILKLDNIFHKFNGGNWENKKIEYENKKNEKIWKKMKDIDPYKEEDWNDK